MQDSPPLSLFIQNLSRPEGQQTHTLFDFQNSLSLVDYVKLRVDLVLQADRMPDKVKFNPNRTDDLYTSSRDENISHRLGDIYTTLRHYPEKSEINMDQLDQAMIAATFDIGHGMKQSLYVIYKYGVGGSVDSESFEDRWSIPYKKREFDRLRSAPVGSLNNEDAIRLQALQNIFGT